MKITGLETIPISKRFLLLKMTTDEGIVGYGEPLDYTHWRIVSAAVNDLAEYLVGRDPFQIEDHWQTFFRSTYSRSMPIIIGALSGIEMAMWDIMGKTLNLPVWKLLGGSVRDRVRVYGASGGNTPETCAKSAQQRVAEGFSAIKMGIATKPVRFVDTPQTVEDMVSRVAAVREAVGKNVDIAVDLHRRFSPTMAILAIKELEPYNLLFAEEPCHPENTEALIKIAQSTHTPIATGERHLTRWGFREIIEREACAILQPDIRHAGGILELKKISNMAEVRDLAVAPHNAAGPIGVAASIHAMATVPNFLICEGGSSRGEGLFKEPLVFQDGFIHLPTGPGLGFELDDDAVEAARDESFRFRGMWRSEEDGSFADY
ncbi:MAG: galactonate dehydratase [bacterium]|nr:galactonate dehydratase [bacterium]